MLAQDITGAPGSGRASGARGHATMMLTPEHQYGIFQEAHHDHSSDEQF